MINIHNFSNHLIDLSNIFVRGLLCLVFLFLSLSSFVTTSVFKQENLSKEHIVYSIDNFFINAVLFIIIIAFLLVLMRCLQKIEVEYAVLALMIYVSAIGMFWVISVKSIPSADSGYIVKAAQEFLNNNYSMLRERDSYFKYYPFQLTFTLICEILMKIFGTENYTALCVFNVICLDFAYLALTKLTSLIFDNKKIELLTIFLLAGCLQAVLMCTYIYGILLGFAFSVWAIVFEVKYLKTRKKHFLVFAAILITLAIIAKLNYSIVLIAMCIILLLDFLKSRKALNIFFAVIMLILAVAPSRLIISSYESIADVNIGKGVPQILWTAMGLQESDRAPGWYNRYSVKVFEKNNYDSSISAQIAKENISERLKFFSQNPRYTLTFFAKKALSQWNEPSYESIWVSQTKAHQSSVSSFVEEIYTGQFGKNLKSYFNIYQQLIFAGFFASLIFCLKKPDLEFTLVPLIILGGIIYHLINEAKSQYILIYFVLLIPFAAYGLNNIITLILNCSGFKRFLKN